METVRTTSADVRYDVTLYEPEFTMSQKSSNKGLIIGLSVAGGLVVLVGAFLGLRYLVLGARNNAMRSRSKLNLSMIGLALHNYHDVHGQLPPAYTVGRDGKKLHSWRVLILPYVEQAPLYDHIRLNEPWDSPHNRRLGEQMPDIYRSTNSSDSTSTSYLAISGKRSAFSGGKSNKFRDMTDGTEKTLMVVEAFGKQIHWMQPDDVSPEEFLKMVENAGESDTLYPSGWLGLFADGSIRIHKAGMDRKTLNGMLIRNDGSAD